MHTAHDLTRFPAWGVYGHDWAIDFLERGLRYGRTRHAYLFLGPDHIGKTSLAAAFAMKLNCQHEDEAQRPCGVCRSCRLLRSGNHPDLLTVVGDERSGQIKIDSVREVMNLLALKPYASRYRVALLTDFDRAQPRAQDALLKTLEEPASHAVLLLIANERSAILPTILSRCQVLPLRPPDQATIEAVLRQVGLAQDQAALLARLSGGRIGWALGAAQEGAVLANRAAYLDSLVELLHSKRQARFKQADELGKVAAKDKGVARYVVETWLSYWRDLVLLGQGQAALICNLDREAELVRLAGLILADDALRALRETRHFLVEVLPTNANVRLALEVLMLEYPFLGQAAR
ncbi:MAG: DNA polymerase III subunit delta' [Anaerolineae bacterium]|nr:DNA polymerase III subunit delta' [Anaerolineae bacterium]MDW8172131.1 DNA polymerase III subunit delta' [Anaerolineae bacterium]